jgi:hypothetical protein
MRTTTGRRDVPNEAIAAVEATTAVYDAACKASVQRRRNVQSVERETAESVPTIFLRSVMTRRTQRETSTMAVEEDVSAWERRNENQEK